MTMGTIGLGRVRIHPLQLVGIPALILAWKVAAFYLRARNPQAASVFPSLGYVFGQALPDMGAFGQQVGRGYAGKVSSYSGPSGCSRSSRCPPCGEW
jgi:hypothetical protein